MILENYLIFFSLFLNECRTFNYGPNFLAFSLILLQLVMHGDKLTSCYVHFLKFQIVNY